MTETFSPSGGSHSLVETLFFIHFAPEIDIAHVKRMGVHTDDIEEILPTKQPLTRHQVTMSVDGDNSSSQAVAGYEFIANKPNGDISWLLNLGVEGITIHCLEYTRWDEVWAKAQRLMLLALKRVPSGVSIAAVGMKNVDRFELSVDPANYDIRQLMRYPNRYITDTSFEAGARWHCYSGWFQPLDLGSNSELKDMEILNQLNITSATVADPRGSRTEVTIDHNAVLRSPEIGTVGVDEDKHDWLDELMKHFHETNKQIIFNILTDETCKRVNLTVLEQ